MWCSVGEAALIWIVVVVGVAVLGGAGSLPCIISCSRGDWAWDWDADDKCLVEGIGGTSRDGSTVMLLKLHIFKCLGRRIHRLTDEFECRLA
jgi:hypothetical protein